MKPKTEKPLKKVQALKQQKERDEQLLKPAVRIQELKNKLIILGHELKVKKQINDSLYRKIQLITYSRTTEQKLKDSYKTLKSIEENIGLADKTEKKKKITVKDFKENKKTVDDDRNILYNMYVKFKGWYIINGKSDETNYKLFKSELGDDIHTLWLIKQITLQTHGKNNIIEEIRQYIETALSNPYTHKIEILDVHVNKEIYQPKQYRFLGGIRRFDTKKNKDYIQFYKAWNASFNYQGFNLDMNNDVPFECVPSALFNTYGIKKDNSCEYLSSVYHGGLPYVKTILNRNNTSQQEDKQINYINPYDEMIKNDEKMIKEHLNQYEYDTDYECDIDTVYNIVDYVQSFLKNNNISLEKIMEPIETEQKGTVLKEIETNEETNEEGTRIVRTK